MFSPGELVAAEWCLYRVLIAESTWRYVVAGNSALFVFLGAYKWDESLLLSSEGRICRVATVHLVGVLMLYCRFVSGDLVCSKSGFISSCNLTSGNYLRSRRVGDEILLCIGVFAIGHGKTPPCGYIMVMRETGELVVTYVDNVFFI
jgi:hypothetical protein